MTDKEKTTQTTQTLYGGVTEAMLAGWKEKYHDKLCVITVVHPITNNTLGCYLRPMGRNEISIATSFSQNKQLVEGGEVILESCWLGGDEVLRQQNTDVFDQQAAASAAMASWKNYPRFEGKAVKNG